MSGSIKNHDMNVTPPKCRQAGAFSGVWSWWNYVKYIIGTILAILHNPYQLPRIMSSILTFPDIRCFQATGVMSSIFSKFYSWVGKNGHFSRILWDGPNPYQNTQISPDSTDILFILWEPREFLFSCMYSLCYGDVTDSFCYCSVSMGFASIGLIGRYFVRIAMIV